MEKPVNSDTGQFEKEVSDDDLAMAVAEREPAGTTEIAEAVDMTRPGVYRRLQQLDDNDRVEVSRIGGSLVWSSVESGRDDTEAVDSSVDHGGETDAEAFEVTIDDDLRNRIEAALTAGEYAVTPERVGAAVAVVEAVRDRGEVTTSEAKRIATEAGVTLGTTGQWWSETARELGCVATTRGSNVYEWDSDNEGETV